MGAAENWWEALKAEDDQSGSTVARPQPPAPTATFTVSGTTIRDPSGATFIPRGLNFGVNEQIGFNTWSNENTAPHVTELKAWGANLWRPNIYASTVKSWIASMGRANAIAQTFAAVDLYTAAGIVCVVSCHDLTPVGGVGPADQAELDDLDFLAQAALRYRSNPYVWFGLNETLAGVTARRTATDNVGRWHEFWGLVHSTIRGQGNTSPLLIELNGAGQDTGANSVPKIYDSSMGPAFIATHDNCIFSQHVYGGLGSSGATGTDHVQGAFTGVNQASFDSAYATYWTNVHNAGLAMIVGETGYRTDGTSDAGSYVQNVGGFYATLNHAQADYGIGMVAWIGTGYSKYGLKSGLSGDGFHNLPFWAGSSVGGDLSLMGTDLWAAWH